VSLLGSWRKINFTMFQFVKRFCVRVWDRVEAFGTYWNLAVERFSFPHISRVWCLMPCAPPCGQIPHHVQIAILHKYVVNILFVKNCRILFSVKFIPRCVSCFHSTTCRCFFFIKVYLIWNFCKNDSFYRTLTLSLTDS